MNITINIDTTFYRFHRFKLSAPDHDVPYRISRVFLTRLQEHIVNCLSPINHALHHNETSSTMGRQESIARSIVAAMTVDPPQRSALRKILAIGAIYGLPLSKVSPALFSKLRREYWTIQWEMYVRSFTPHPGEKVEDVLHAVGDMGFSGSVCPLRIGHNHCRDAG